MKKFALFLLVVFFVATAAQAVIFSSFQSVNVAGGSEWSKTYVMDLTHYSQVSTAILSGDYTVDYMITYDVWYDICVYNASLGRWDELIYLLNLHL